MGSPVRDVLNVKCPWDIPGDMSRKQMARNAGLNLREKVRPEWTVLRTAIASAGSGEAMGAVGQEPRAGRAGGEEPQCPR